jgi:hypothetical protein
MPSVHAPCMFTVSETEAAAIRTAFEQQGELSAAIELRRLFPGVTDNVQARECARVCGLAAATTRCLAAGTGRAVGPDRDRRFR